MLAAGSFGRPKIRLTPKDAGWSSNDLVANIFVDNIFVGMYSQSVNRQKLKRATGNWVVGDHFWDREKELPLFLEEIREGAHLLLTAPRRIGKTSLLKEAARRLEGDFLCIYIDLEKAQSPADAVVELGLAAHDYKSIWNRMASVFQHVLGETIETVKIKDLSVTLRSGLTSDNWRSKGDQLFDILANQEQPVVVLFDEVAILVNRLLRGADYEITDARREEVDIFLSWLRANTIRHQGKIRFVITGSIGLEPLVRQAGLSATLNTFTPFHLGPWTREAAAGCLKALSNNYSLMLNQDASERMLDLLAVYVPHHVQVFFGYVYQSARLEDVKEVSIETVERVYNESMLGIRGHVELSHMEERLKIVFGPKLDLLALDLLTEAAVTGKINAETAKLLAKIYLADEWRAPLRDVLGILEHDGYLRSSNEVYAFVPGLLRDWWCARFKFAYIPAAQRRTPHE